MIFGFSFTFKNSTFYDAYWSVAPPILGGYWWVGAGMPSDPVFFACYAVTCWWAVRLTYNWGRRWEGLHDEDWRYIDLAEKTDSSHPQPRRGHSPRLEKSVFLII